MLDAASCSQEKKRQISKLVEGRELATSEVVELLASHNTLAKKLTCAYIANKCCTNADLALLTANLLLKDASDANPSVRSASILALASLPGLEDSAIHAVTVALTDQAPTVRRGAAVACVGLHGRAPQLVLQCGLTEALYQGLRDPDPLVLTSCCLALDTILGAEGGMVVNRAIAHHLLTSLVHCSQASATYLLTLLLRYQPGSQEELMTLLDVLDTVLVCRAPAVLTAAVRLFLSWTTDHPHLKKDVLELVQPSLCKVLSRNVPETCYLVLDFLCSLGDIHQVFGPHYKYFLVRAKDPGYLKEKKLQLLPLVSNESNVCSLMEEVKPFCSDYQSFAWAAKCVGALAQVSPGAHAQCLALLVQLLQAPSDRVVVAALECLLNVVLASVGQGPSPTQAQDPSLLQAAAMEAPQATSADPQEASQTGQELPLLPKELVEAVSRAVGRGSIQEGSPWLVLQVVGALASQLGTAPAVLQRMASLGCLYPATHCDLVTAAARVFLACPAQSQLILASVLARAFRTPGPVASHAAMVYSVLQEPPLLAAQLLGANTIQPVTPSQSASTNQPLTPSQSASTNQAMTPSQPLTLSQSPNTNQAMTPNQPAITIQPLTPSQPASTSQPLTPSQPASTSQAMTPNQSAITIQPLTPSQPANTNQPLTPSQSASTNQAMTPSQSAITSQPLTPSQPASTNQPLTPSQSISTSQSASTIQPVSPSQSANSSQLTTPNQSASTNQPDSTNRADLPSLPTNQL